MPKKTRYTLFFLFFIPIALIGLTRSWGQLTVHIHNHDMNIAHSDAEGYYSYLPALLIYKSFEHIPIRSTEQFERIAATNRYYNKYTFGVSILQAPFFLISDLICQHSKFERNGYSRPYQLGMLFSAIFYFFVGMIFLGKGLLKYFPGKVVWTTLLALFFGTNLLHYTFVEPGMSHVYSFFLCAAMLYYTPTFYANRNSKAIIRMGCILSLMVFIRPTNVILTLYFFLFEVASWKSLNDRIHFYLKNFTTLLVMAIPFVFLSVIQIGLWSHMWGELVIFSYNTEPGFIYWYKPRMFSVWFHSWNGLFIYAPILLFSVFGLALGLLKKKTHYWTIGIIFLLSTYVFGSWWAWWFGGAFGARNFVDMLPLLAIPLAYLSHQVFKNGKILPSLTFGITYYVFIFYSVRMMNKYIPPWDGPKWNWQTWWEVVQTII